MLLAKRVQQLPPYPFVEISRLIARKRAEGRDVVTFGIGDPDLPTPQPVLERLEQAARVERNHRYPESEGLPEFRQAVAAWYLRRFGVGLDPEREVVSLIGAKEGIGHAALALLDPGDVALLPDPGYPVYNAGTIFAGAVPHWVPLDEESGWLPDLERVPLEVARRARVLWLNYPNNPTGAVAPPEFFQRAVGFCRRHGIALLHDACYSEVAYDGYRPPSVLEVPGARDVALEFHSLSKTFNMTGWRIGMAVGSAELVRALFQVKSNLDSGVPQAVQEMGIAALELPQGLLDQRNRRYQARRDRLVKALSALGLGAPAPRASLYVWARVPDGFTSAGFAAAVLEDLDIVVTPGPSYGSHGEGYVRLSLTLPDERLEEGVRRLEGWSLPRAR